jgi:hypothetical protein
LDGSERFVHPDSSWIVLSPFYLKNISRLLCLTIHLPSQFFSVCIESALLISLAVMVFDAAARKWTSRFHGHHARMVEWAASAL